MKKTVSLLLCLSLLLALCPAVFAVNSDYAAFYLTEYKVQAGDTLTAICETRGLKYAEYATIIKNVNGIANPNALVAGRSYWIPTKSLGEAESYYIVYRHVLTSGETISALCTGYGTTTNAVGSMLQAINGVSSLTGFSAGTAIYLPVPGGKLTAAAEPGKGTTGTTTGTTSGVNAQTVNANTNQTANASTGDYVGFYLTPYVCQSGDTLTAICAARGVSYASYKTMILKLNKLASETSLIAGRSYWMPASTVGSAATYYTVYRHLLVPGDTMFALCNAYNINMTKYTDLILTINGKTNLTSFQAGKYVNLPVYHVGAASGAGTPAAPAANTGLDDSKAGVGTGTTTTQSGLDANGNPITVTTTTSTTVQEIAGLFDPTAAASYYLVPHTVAAGESIVSICNDMATSFSKARNIIVAANALQSYSLTVGSTLLIPCQTNNGAAKYVAVTNRTIKSGDTVYGYYCEANADFSANYKLLTDLNSGVNFNNLAVGARLAVPVQVG